MFTTRLAAAALLLASPVFAQTSTNPFPDPIPATAGVIEVGIREFASLPDIAGQPARMMLLMNEPGTRRLFVNDMRGPLYTVSNDGKSVALYLDLNAATWGVGVQSQGNERGFYSFAFHPDFTRTGAPGYGKFYTYVDVVNTTPPADFVPNGGNNTHDTVLLEWTAKNPAAAAYDGGAPRELIRFEQPFANHNAGQIAFHPGAARGSADYGLLYISFGDGGSGGDPLNNAQKLDSIYGKILRIDPLGNNSTNKKYGIPASNPFVSDNNPATLGEIYVSGVRNAQRFGWDPRNGNFFVADIGQNTVEEISVAKAGDNLGWNTWEASFTFVNRAGVGTERTRGDARMVYPVVEYDHTDPLFLPNVAVTFGAVYRSTAIKQLTNLVIFGDNPSGEVFYINADKLPQGGQAPIRRILFRDGTTQKTLLQMIKEKAAASGKPAAARADLRFGYGTDGQLFLLNKRDGTIRLLIPDGAR